MKTIEATPTQHPRPLLGLRRRPGRLALTVFRLPLVLYRHGWGWLLGTTFMLLVHAGRKTGEPHPMTAMVMSWTPSTREVVIFSGWGPNSDWVRNLRTRPALRVEVGREHYTPQHRFLSETESVAVASDFVRGTRTACEWPPASSAGRICTRRPSSASSSAPTRSWRSGLRPGTDLDP